MAPRRVIADSDDEGDDFSPVKPVAHSGASHDDLRLDVEPLSPQHQPTSPMVRQPSLLAVANNEKDTSGSTDPSFFANIYDEHGGKALQQSHLIESIVRLTQKASASSGDISLPTKGKGKGNKSIPDASSAATDITSPALVTKQPPRKSQLAQMSDATEITTPKKSGGKDEWDVPSSGDEAEGLGQDVTKSSKRLVEDSSKIMVQVPSTLSASQKRQYRKVQISESNSGDSAIADSGGQMQPPSHYKSSCATTVAVSTPSRYASSGPRLPWETEPEAESDQAANTSNESHAVDLTLSSPDVIATNGDKREEEESPIRRPSIKRKRPTPRDDDDELGQDATYDDPLSDLDPEFSETQRRTSKKSKQASKSSTETPPIQPKKRGRKKKIIITQEIAPEDDLQVEELPPETASIQIEVADTPVPAEKPKKKRGRPRKSEPVLKEEAAVETLPAMTEPAAEPVTDNSLSEEKVAEDGSTTIEDSWKQSAAEISAKSGKNDGKGPKQVASPLKETNPNASLLSQPTISESDKSICKTSTPSQAGKIGYRVGLSKRSRIAPLLKIIKK